MNESKEQEWFYERIHEVNKQLEYEGYLGIDDILEEAFSRGKAEGLEWTRKLLIDEYGQEDYECLNVSRYLDAQIKESKK